MSKRVWLDYSKVRGALDFGTVLNHYSIEYPAGRAQIKIICPFHEESTPSMSINVPDGKFHCFGCGDKGNVLEFVAHMEHHDPSDKDGLYAAAEIAVGIMGRTPAEFTKRGAGDTASPRSAPVSTKGAKLPQETTTEQKRFDRRPLPETPQDDEKHEPSAKAELEPNPLLDLNLTLDPAHPMIAARGIDAETARIYGIGYCDQGIMKHRVCFQIRNEDGGLVAYAGRYATEEVPQGIERYRLPKRFHKSLVLYNLHRAKALDQRHLVLVEGYWSAIRLDREKIAVAALLGTSCSDHQAALIPAAGFKFVTVLLDGDDAGRKAAPEVVMTLASKVYVRVLELPFGVKPDTMPEPWLAKLRSPLR